MHVVHFCNTEPMCLFLAAVFTCQQSSSTSHPPEDMGLTVSLSQTSHTHTHAHTVFDVCHLLLRYQADIYMAQYLHNLPPEWTWTGLSMKASVRVRSQSSSKLGLIEFTSSARYGWARKLPTVTVTGLVSDGPGPLPITLTITDTQADCGLSYCHYVRLPRLHYQHSDLYIPVTSGLLTGLCCYFHLNHNSTGRYQTFMYTG